MLFDIYLIILTGFAMFGIYCFLEAVFNIFSFRKMPLSVMIVRNNTDEYTMKKIKFAEQNIPNNYTVFYPFSDEEDKEKQMEILNEYLEGVLGVKSVNNR